MQTQITKIIAGSRHDQEEQRVRHEDLSVPRFFLNEFKNAVEKYQKDERGRRDPYDSVP